MSTSVVDRVLACPTLPSLPSVAMEVLELTRQPDVPVRDIAATVQNDQALSAKILRTVNSSFYGLSTPCSTIARAISYLGLNTVKSLVLGFSLIDAFGEQDGEGFSPIDHWRRAVYGATGARLLAPKFLDGIDPDEAFIAGLMQDIGVLAMFTALGERYAAVAGAVTEHNDLPADERDAFEADHAQVGFALAEKWRLPASIAAAIRWHHAPENSTPEHQQMVRVIVLARLAAATLRPQPSPSALAEYRRHARDWCGIDAAEADKRLAMIAESAYELAGLFQIETGERPDVSSLLSEASDRLVEHQMQQDRDRMALQQQALTDGLTGVPNRKAFDSELMSRFAEANENDGSLAVIFFDADRFKGVNDTHGHQAGDAVLVEMAKRAVSAVGDKGTVARYGGEEFAAVLPGLGTREAAQLGEAVRAAMEAQPFDMTGVECQADELPITISVGVAAREPGTGHAVTSADIILRAADKAVYAAKSAGRNCVRLVRLDRLRRQDDTPKRAAAAPVASAATAAASAPVHTERRTPSDEAAAAGFGVPAPQPGDKRFGVMIVEDDKLHRTLIQSAFKGEPGYELFMAESAEQAMTTIEGMGSAAGDRLGLILCDVGLPGMSGTDLVRTLRGRSGFSRLPIVMLSASEDKADVEASLSAGANAYMTKASICDDPKNRVRQIAEYWASTAQAA